MYSTDLQCVVSIDLAVAMMAAAQADVVIEIEESPIVNAEVSNDALLKEATFPREALFINLCSLHFTASSRKGETLSFHTLST